MILLPFMGLHGFKCQSEIDKISCYRIVQGFLCFEGLVGYQLHYCYWGYLESVRYLFIISVGTFSAAGFMDYGSDVGALFFSKWYFIEIVTKIRRIFSHSMEFNRKFLKISNFVNSMRFHGSKCRSGVQKLAVLPRTLYKKLEKVKGVRTYQWRVQL